MTQPTNARQAGFTIAEILVASTIFLIVAMVAYTAMVQGNQSYQRGDMLATMQQKTRLAFDQMMTELRMAGFDFNRDGEENEYPDQPDEQMEWIGPHALTFRGNLDSGDADTGREPAYQTDPSDPNYGFVCCPIVTTANDEIVTYALRSDDGTKNTDSIEFSVDVSVPRDGGWDAAGAPANEERVTIDDIDLTTDNPPYSLVRFWLDDAGNVQERVVATDIRSLTFSFEGEDGEETFCPSPNPDGTCPGGTAIPFADVGGLDDVNAGDQVRRAARAAVRRVVVELVGMTDRNVPHYKDNDSAMPGRPKLALESAIVPQNLGIRGRPDLEDQENLPPENVTACGGQCNTVRVEWDAVNRAVSYNVKLVREGQADPFFTAVTPGVAIPGSSPERVFAVFQRPDSAAIVSGTRLLARVQARFFGDETSDDSLPSDTITIEDVVRPAAPTGMRATGYDSTATGWPDVTGNLIPPMTTGTTTDVAQPNRIVVSWEAPRWALQVTDPASPATSWTTATGAGEAPLECDQQLDEAASTSVSPVYRTRLREHFGAVRYLIFRSTNPRFVPTASDFVGAVQGDVDTTTMRVSFTDLTVHRFTNGIFNETLQSVANCTTYYYRVRAVDDCWSGTDPAVMGDPHVSPFAPPLNPDPAATDSDDVSLLSPSQVGLAIPGYSIPKAAPRAPRALRFNAYDRRTDDGDGRDATLAFDAVKMDETMNGTTPAYEDVTITEYRVYSHPTNPNFTLSDMKNMTSGVQLDKTIAIADLRAGRIAWDDEDGDGTVEGHEDEVVMPSGQPTNVQPKSGLRIDLDATASRFYKLVAVQCRNEDTVPDTDPTLYDLGTPSAAIRFPCDFGGGPYSSVTLNSANFPISVVSDATMENPAVTARYARLALRDPVTGDRTMTAPPGKAPSANGTGQWRVTFNEGEIAALTDNFGSGSYRVAVEWEDANGCLTVTDSDDQTSAPPSCCLTPLTPTLQRVTTTEVRNTVQISCGAQALRLMKITVTVDNANGNQTERFSQVVWDDPDTVDDRTWTANRTSEVFDLTANPSVLGLDQLGVLRMVFNRNVVGNNITIRYDYKIGGATGACTFTGRVQ